MRNLIICFVLMLPLVSFGQPRKDFKNGTFGVKSTDNIVAEAFHIVRKGKKQVEFYDEYISEYRVKWISDNVYTMTLVESTRPNFPENNVTVNIISVRENEYTALVQSSVFGVFKVIIFRES